MKTSWPRPEFLPLPARPPALAWAWAATGALVLVATLAEGFAMQRGIDEQSVRLSMATQRNAKAAPPRVAAPVAGNNAAAEAQAVRAAQRVARDLAHPWGQILASVESETPAGLQWLLFDHDVDSPNLRLEGLAPDVSTALGLVDALSARQGWSDVVVTRLLAAGAREPAGNPTRWRFEISAVVDARRIAAVQAESGG